MNELYEGIFQSLEVTAIRRHVIRIDVGDHRDHRLKIEKRRVALVGLGNQIAAGPETRVGACAVEKPADHERGIQPCRLEDRRDHARGRGLAVGTGHRHPVAIAHQLSQHFCSGDRGDAKGVGGHELRIVIGDGARYHHHIGALHVGSALPNGHLRAEALQSLGGLSRREVRAADLVTLIEQHLGNARHARTTDADEVNAADASHQSLGRLPWARHRSTHDVARPSAPSLQFSRCARAINPTSTLQTIRLLPP